MSNKIQIKRGLKANLPILDSGEPGFTTDTKEFFIGDGSTNIEFAKQANLEINNTRLLDMIYQKAGGTATVVTVPMQTLVNGYSKTFVASANNNGADTTVNGKKLYKPGTIKSPNLIAGKAYTVWYDLEGDCFFIKASAEGDADISHVLASKKFSNDNDTGLTGTMPNNGAVNQSLAINGTYTIPAGYHNGSGKVTQSIATKAEATITPSTVNQIISANQFLTGIQTILGDSDLIASNIISTANIFGIQGTANIQSLGGLKIQSGQTPIGAYTQGSILSLSGAATETHQMYLDLSQCVSFIPKIVFGHRIITSTSGDRVGGAFCAISDIANGGFRILTEPYDYHDGGGGFSPDYTDGHYRMYVGTTSGSTKVYIKWTILG